MLSQFTPWQWTIMIVLFLICMMVLITNFHPFVIRFEMDNNTLEAIKAINWSALS